MTLTSSPTYNSSSLGSSDGSLKVSETATYTASYTIAQNAVDSGSINNTLLATASSPGQTNNVTDTSDDGIDNDGNTIDDPTVVSITASPSIEVTKTSTITDNGDGTLGNGDLVKYTITVENKGNVTLSNISLTDILKDSNNVSLNLSSGPFFSGSNQGSAEGSIIPDETATYIAYFIINQGVVDAGGVSNTGSVTASSPGNSNDVSDISDDGDDTDGNTTNDSTDININASPTIEVTKTFTLSDNGDGKTGAGDSIVYLIKVENKGNVTLSGLSITDTLTDGNGGSLSFNNSPTFSLSLIHI